MLQNRIDIAFKPYRGLFSHSSPNVLEKRRRYQISSVTLNDMMQSEFYVRDNYELEIRRYT